ncbi:MAG TPA: pseudouridine synthase [Candidatus Limiplasma sp.]|nr:pseudouridine synthase [Candidatus Limiplasma sp.]
MRLDKLLSQSGERSRSEAAKLIRAGFVSVDGTAIASPAYKADPERNAVCFQGKRITDHPYQYMMLHKPAGVVTAARDNAAETVMRLVPNAMRARGVMPVGRLDKDTTGLLLFTNDGMLAHRLLSPKHHVWKEYRVTVDGMLTDADINAFAEGIALKDFTAKPAELSIVSADRAQSTAIVRLREGKYHQVKRMFGARDLQVTALHRQSFGPLRLDIPCGGIRILRQQEIDALYAAVQLDGERHDD